MVDGREVEQMRKTEIEVCKLESLVDALVCSGLCWSMSKKEGRR